MSVSQVSYFPESRLFTCKRQLREADAYTTRGALIHHVYNGHSDNRHTFSSLNIQVEAIECKHLIRYILTHKCDACEVAPGRRHHKLKTTRKFISTLLILTTVAPFLVIEPLNPLGTPGRGHIHATAAQRNVRSNSLLKAHLGDVAGRKRVRLVCSSESAAQWHHNQRFCLIKDGHLASERGKETWDFQRICMGFVAPRDQRLSERQRCTA